MPPASTAAGSHILVLSSHILNILSPMFSEYENFETFLGFGESHTH